MWPWWVTSLRQRWIIVVPFVSRCICVSRLSANFILSYFIRFFFPSRLGVNASRYGIAPFRHLCVRSISNGLQISICPSIYHSFSIRFTIRSRIIFHIDPNILIFDSFHKRFLQRSEDSRQEWTLVFLRFHEKIGDDRLSPGENGKLARSNWILTKLRMRSKVRIGWIITPCRHFTSKWTMLVPPKLHVFCNPSVGHYFTPVL